MNAKKLSLVVLVMAVVMLAACGGPNFQNERNKYNICQNNIKEMAGKYGNFRSLMVPVSQDAAALAKEAESLPEGETKAKKMREAYNVFGDNEFYRNLSNFDRRLESVNKDITKWSATFSTAHRNKIDRVVTYAQKMVVEATNLMMNAMPKTNDDAVTVIKEANGKLISVQGKFRSLKNEVNGKKKSIFKKKKKKK